MSRQKGDNMRDIIISLKPYYYYLIGENIKKVEVRKSYPKADDWSRRAWFYMSRDEKSFAKIPKEFQEKYRNHFGKVGMRFVCDQITLWNYDQAFDESMGVFIDKFGYDITDYELGKTCLPYEEFSEYGNTQNLYGLNIPDLVVYDEPRELSEFKTPDWYADCEKCNYLEKMRCPVKDSHKADIMATACRRVGKPITRPPMSWQFCVATEPRQTAD